MKIAAITDDGKTISQHFGRASHYLVVSVVDGEITGRELRPKLGHTHFVTQDHAEDSDSSLGHGFGESAHRKHHQMAETISDCEALLCRGMGRGAYVSMQNLGIRPVVTDIPTIDEAVTAFVAGEIVDHTEKLH